MTARARDPGLFLIKLSLFGDDRMLLNNELGVWKDRIITITHQHTHHLSRVFSELSFYKSFIWNSLTERSLISSEYQTISGFQGSNIWYPLQVTGDCLYVGYEVWSLKIYRQLCSGQITFSSRLVWQRACLSNSGITYKHLTFTQLNLRYAGSVHQVIK